MLDDKNKKILDDIKESNSVSIHFRRGDYATLSHYFFQANWVNYYGGAVAKIMNTVGRKNLKFFIFSDDIEYAKKNTIAPNTFFVEENKGLDSWKDMMLMSNCKHNITANSTFSWWAAWLNKNKNKVITTPYKWFLDGTDSTYIIPYNWKRL